MDKKIIYLDSASTTKVNETVLTEMLPYFSEKYGNANSLHQIGQICNKAIANSRETIAKDFNCNPNELFFTSCGSEANNWAIKGYALANKNKGNHIIISAIEHDSILESAKFLKSIGFNISYVKPQKDGHVNVSSIEKLITNKTILISVMAVNNETGCIQPIEDISKIARKNNIAYHVDFVQALSQFVPNVKKIRPDLLTISSHKIHGPKGIGLLYIKHGTHIIDLLDGGSQEFGKRAGTSNTPLIVGFAKAIEINCNNRINNANYYKKLNYLFLSTLKNNGIDYIINGCQPKVENILNISFPNIDAEGLLHILDEKGICISVGSACNSTNKKPSHVLKSMGISLSIINSSVRISFDEFISEDDIIYSANVISDTIKTIKKMKGWYPSFFN